MDSWEAISQCQRRVLFLFGGTPHYYNFILNRLNSLPDTEVSVATPVGKSATVGDGVFETADGIEFALHRLVETKVESGALVLNGLASLIDEIRPNIVVTIMPYLDQCLKADDVQAALQRNRCSLILKDHPFRLPTFDEQMVAAGEKESLYRWRRGLRVARSLLRSSYFPKCLIRPTLAGLSIQRRLRNGRRSVDLANQLQIKCRNFQTVDAIVCYIEDGFRVFGSYGVARERIFVTRNSPDTEVLFRAKQKLESKGQTVRHPKRLIHLGRLVPWKRVDLLIEAFKLVRETHNDAELRIVGYGPEEDVLRELVARNDLESRVEFAGGVYEPEEVGRVLMESAIYVLAGMGGLSLNDAMTFGLPVVCSVGDGTEKYLLREGVNGRFFLEGDPQDLARVLTKLLDNPKRLEEMGAESEMIIRSEVNVHTVVAEYVRAFEFVETRSPDMHIVENVVQPISDS